MRALRISRTGNNECNITIIFLPLSSYCTFLNRFLHLKLYAPLILVTWSVYRSLLECSTPTISGDLHESRKLSELLNSSKLPAYFVLPTAKYFLEEFVFEQVEFMIS
jgi:hypothetical protein